MKSRSVHQPIGLFAVVILSAMLVHAQTGISRKQRSDASQRAQASNFTPADSPSGPPVKGSGTIGLIPKWIDTDRLDDSIISQSGEKIGIGTTSPTSKLTVAGMIEITLGGLKFPDGTVQTTAALSPSLVVRSLNGLMGDLTLQAGANITITPSGNMLTIAAPNSLSAVMHNATLTGNGTSASPLGVAVPLLLRGSSSPQPILTVQNDGFGFALQGNGLDQNGLAGYSNTADGTSGQTNGANHSGVLGINTNSAGWGVRGNNASNGNYGYLGGPSSGVYGFSSSGNGVAGQSSTGLAGNFIGNVSISGSLGIGASPSGSKLAVGGLIQSTSDGFQFPDGTIQTTAATNASGNSIQNTTAQQPNSNFNISGNGTVGGELQATVVTAQAFFKIGNHRMVSLGVDPDVDTSTDTFVGIDAGRNNLFDHATRNSFFGRDAGKHNNGAANTFLGYQAGLHNVGDPLDMFLAGSRNTFVGYQSGLNNGSSGAIPAGNYNTFLGDSAGKANVDGNNNTAVGAQADVGADNLSFATAIGSGAVVSSSDTIVLGRSDGGDIVDVPGKLQIDTLATAGSTNLCLNGSNRVGTCSSSLRYKTDLRPFAAGMAIINRLQPISFTWKDGGMRDVGFGAEDVQKIEPLLVTYNSQGLVEGVKYDRITVALVNAIKEQQQQLAAQQTQIESLKKLICLDHPYADVCKPR